MSDYLSQNSMITTYIKKYINLQKQTETSLPKIHWKLR